MEDSSSSADARAPRAKVVVFWDWDNKGLPLLTSYTEAQVHMLNNIIAGLAQYGQLFDMRIFVDVVLTRIDPHMRNAINKRDIQIVDVPRCKGEASDTAITHHIHKTVNEMQFSSLDLVLCVISDDGDFVKVLDSVRSDRVRTVYVTDTRSKHVCTSHTTIRFSELCFTTMRTRKTSNQEYIDRRIAEVRSECVDRCEATRKFWEGKFLRLETNCHAKLTRMQAVLDAVLNSAKIAEDAEIRAAILMFASVGFPARGTQPPAE